MATKFITVSIEIMHDKNLNQSQKFIYAEIEQLSQLDKGCIASNNHFSELIGITKENVSRNINDLADKGYISIEIVKGTRNHTRIITLTTLVRPPYQNSKTPLLKQQETKENRTINRTINTKNKQKDLAEEYITIKNVTSESNKEIVKDFVEYRKEISKPLKTIRPIQLFVDELIKLKDLGYSFEHSIKEMKNNEWQTVKVGYIHKPKQQRTYQDKTAGRQRAIKEAFQILEQQQGEVIDYE